MPFHHLFRNPPTAYRPVPFWFWNGDMDTEKIVYQIREMAEKGLGGFFIHARQGLTIPYLSDLWFQLVAVAIETAQQYGLHAWLYDEYPYPSGMSGGEVLLQHPDAKQRQLLHCSVTVTGLHSLSYELPWAKVLSAQAIPLEEPSGTPRWSDAIELTSFIGSVPAEFVFQSTGLTTYTNKRFFTAHPQKRLVWDVPSGRWMVSVLLEKEMDDFKFFGSYVDPCHKEAIQTFLATTHEQYARRFSKHFGQTIKGMFTDEVGLIGHIPWSARLPAFFHERYGYELADHLSALLSSMGERTAQVRYHFFQSIHLLLGEAYHQRVNDWCERHHLQYLTEVPSVRMTTQCSSHIPGGDSAHEKVGRSLEWILERYAYSLRGDPKIVSSLASQLGRERAMIECFHSVGWSMTLQDAKWMLDRLAALGINFFVFHAFFSSISGLRKHDAPPSQFLQNPYWPYFRHLADYAGRLGYAMSQGRAYVPIAVVHPTTTFWTHMGNPFQEFRYCGSDVTEEEALERLKQDWAYLCKQLLLRQVDYDHLDPELLTQAIIEEGHLTIGQARYEVLILPPMTNLESEAWSQVKAFSRAGGKVISVGLLPYERIDGEQHIETEMLEWFGLTISPRQHYWQGVEEKEEGQVEECPWTKGAYAAYFIPSPGRVQHTHTIERLLALLQQCAPPTIVLEPVVGDRTSFLIRERSLPDGSEFIFITHQEGTEKILRLHLAQPSTRPIVKRLDLTSGQVSLIPVEKTANGWSIFLSFSPYESYLLHCTSHGETQAAEVVPSEKQQPWLLALDVEQPWRLTAQQDNLLRLGSFRFTLDLDSTGLEKGWHEGEAGQTWPLVEAKPLVNQCADVATMQTFPMQFKQFFGLPMRGSLAYPLHCWYQTTFFVEQIPPVCKLLMDEDAIGGSYALYLNGKKITAYDFVPVFAYGYQQQACEVQHMLKQGKNSLVIHVEARRDEDGVRDPLYLSGPFGVSFNAVGVSAIGKPPETGRPRPIEQDYPYFAGTLCFTSEVSIEAVPHERMFELALQGWDQRIHDCVEFLVNGHSLGVCSWHPYHWEGASDILREGRNTIEIRVTNTLNGMLEGSCFDEDSHRIVPLDQFFASR